MVTRFLPVFLLTAALSFAQQKSDLAGDYSGSSGPVQVKLHLTAGRNGTLTGTIDSPDQGISGLQCADIQVNGQALSFTVPAVHATWDSRFAIHRQYRTDDFAALKDLGHQAAPVEFESVVVPFNFGTGIRRGDTGKVQRRRAAQIPHAGYVPVQLKVEFLG
jgi:hypothetical protein